MKILCLSVFGVGNAVDKIPAIRGMLQAGHTVDVIQDSRGKYVLEAVPGIGKIWYYLASFPSIMYPPTDYDYVFGMPPANGWLDRYKKCGKQFIGRSAAAKFDQPDYLVNYTIAKEHGLITMPIEYISPRLYPPEGIHNLPPEIVDFVMNRKFVVGMHTGGSSTWPWKRLHVNAWLRCMDVMRGAGVDGFVLFGAGDDFNMWGKNIDVLLKDADDVFVQTKPYSLQTIRTIMQYGLHGMVSTDSGLMHLAAACGVRTIGIFGPTCEIKNAPHGLFKAVHANVSCRPCQFEWMRMVRCTNRVCLDMDDVVSDFTAKLEWLHDNSVR